MGWGEAGGPVRRKKGGRPAGPALGRSAVMLGCPHEIRRRKNGMGWGEAGGPAWRQKGGRPAGLTPEKLDFSPLPNRN
jgi:hypothetical protein